MKILTIVTAILLCCVLIVGVAGAAEIQYIKINPGPLDQNFNAHVVDVNITVDTIGNLTYLEEYFAVDSYGQPLHYDGIRHEETLKTNSVTFSIMRPRDKQGREYTSIETKVLMENKVIFDEWIPIGSTYRVNNLKNVTKNRTVVRSNTTTINKPIILERPNSINKTIIEDQKAPGFDIVVAAIAIFGVCFLRRSNIRK